MEKKSPFDKLVYDILENDIDEIIEDINQKQLSEIKKRPHIKLPDGHDYIKNSYDYLGDIDFKLLFDIKAEKAFKYVENSDFENALDEEIKLFIIRLNPQIDDLIHHEPVNQVNIDNLNVLIGICETDDLDELFDKNWDLKKPIVPKEKSFKLLKGGLESSDLDKLNKMAEKYYFNL